MFSNYKHFTSIVIQLLLLYTLALTAQADAHQILGDSDTLDYRLSENWAYQESQGQKEADVFLVCPTVDMGQNGNHNMDVSDPTLRQNFINALKMERGIYDDRANLYAPFYRQISFPVYSYDEKRAQPYRDIAYKDVQAAYIYFMKHRDSRRPIILAGFSQGSEILIHLLKEHGLDKDLQENLVAAYCLGWRITAEDLSEYPHLRVAQSENDIGVMIAFNSEDISINDSLMVPHGIFTYGINPLNWKTDETPASKEENIGSCFTDNEGNITSEVLNLTGAYLDKERGTLKVTDIVPTQCPCYIFPDGVYHCYDYKFFYRNLEQNVGVRLDSWFSKNYKTEQASQRR